MIRRIPDKPLNFTLVKFVIDFFMEVLELKSHRFDESDICWIGFIIISFNGSEAMSRTAKLDLKESSVAVDFDVAHVVVQCN